MYIRLHVTPGAKREAFTRVNSELFKVNVREEAKHNLANKQALRVLADHLGLAPQKLRIIHGHQSPHKIVHIDSSP